MIYGVETSVFMHEITDSQTEENVVIFKVFTAVLMGNAVFRNAIL